MGAPRIIPTSVLVGPPGRDGSNVLPTELAMAAAVNGGGAFQAALAASIAAQAAAGWIPGVMLVGPGIDYTGATFSTAAIQARIDAAPAGTIFRLLPGIIKITTLTLDDGKSLVGAGWMSYRDAAESFGDSDYANNAYFAGTIIRSTATTGAAITVSDSTTVQAPCLQDFYLIGPGSGTSIGVVIGSLTHSVINPRTRIAVANFATCVKTMNINEGELDLTVRGGGTIGASFEANTNAVRILLNAQRCADGAQTDSTTIALNFISPVLQANTGTGLIINGKQHKITDSYAESAAGVRAIDFVSGSGHTLDTPFGSSAADKVRVQAAVTQMHLIGVDPTKLVDETSTSITDGPRLWTTISGGVGFQNSYVNASGYTTEFRRTPDGAHLELIGGVSGGAGGVVAFTLPAGFRPLSQKVVLVADSTAGSTLQAIIATNGNVTIYGGSAGDIRVINIVIPLD